MDAYRIAEREEAIRRQMRERVRMAHREPWLIGSPDAQHVAVSWARLRHTESISRERSDFLSDRRPDRWRVEA